MEIDKTSDETPDTVLPLMYKDPHDKDVYWICDRDEEKRITSVFLGHGERYSTYFESEKDALHQEGLLRGVGWVKCKKPEITFTMDEKSKRKQERAKTSNEKPKQTYSEKRNETLSRLRSKISKSEE